MLVFAIVMQFSQAQTESNLTFFSEDNETFTVFLNGVEQNQKPLTNVKLKKLPASNYHVKIVFTDVNNNDISKTLRVEAGTDASFMIKTRNDGGKVLAVLGESSPGYEREIYTESHYFINEDEMIYDNYDRGRGRENVNVNVNVNESGVNVNVDVNEGVYHDHNVFDEYDNRPGDDHYIMPGYNGLIGCPWPMEPNNFSRAKQTIQNSNFESDKLIISKQITNTNCLTSEQVKQIVGLFNFEKSRLEFAKFAYTRTYDIENYFIVNDAFDFSASKRELSNYMLGLGRY